MPALTDTGEAPEEDAAPSAPDGSRARRMYFVSAVVTAGVLLDQVCKLAAIALLDGKPPVILFGGFFRFEWATNTGAFLSLGSTLPDGARFLVLTGFNAVILGGVAVYLIMRREMVFAVTLSLSLILSGGIGNLIDRLFRDGKVIDFMNLSVPGAHIPIVNWPLRTGIFNVADLAIMAGLAILIVSELFRRPDPKEAGAE